MIFEDFSKICGYNSSFIKKYCKIYKITKITLGSTRNQNGYNKNCQKINRMETVFIKTSRKTKIDMAGPSRRGFKDESEKLEREV